MASNVDQPFITEHKTISLSQPSPLFKIFIASLLIALSSWVEIPLFFTPIPVTLQTLLVLLVGGYLGSKQGLAAVSTFLMAGCMGMPVFAGGSFGALYLLGPTGGYLFGFAAAAYFVGFCGEHGGFSSPLKAFLSNLGAMAILYIFGLTWLGAMFVGFDKVLALGFYPFVIGALLKVALASLLLYRWKKI